MKNKTYYLASLESKIFTIPRKCKFLNEMQFETGKECVLVCLDPPVVGQDYGVAEDIRELILSCRHEGDKLSSIKEFPCFVFIARFLDTEYYSDIISSDKVEVVAWGELYRNKYDAENHVFDECDR